MLNASKIAIRKALGVEFPMLEGMLIEFENAQEMRKWFGWDNEPLLAGERLRDLVAAPLWDTFRDPLCDSSTNPLEMDFRVLHDAEVVYGMTANLGGAAAFEIGKSFVEGDGEGDHNAESIYDETLEALSAAEAGDYILWHEFDLALAGSHNYIYEVCVGLEELFRSRLLQGNIYHLRDSWVGLYRVPSLE